MLHLAAEDHDPYDGSHFEPYPDPSFDDVAGAQIEVLVRKLA